MKKNKIIALIFLPFCIFFASCSENEPAQETKVEPIIINENSEITAADTSSTGVYQEEVKDGPTSLKDALKANATQEIVEEGGLSFCDCVKKQKALNDLIMETEDDAEMEKAMKELEDMKTGDCRVLFSAKQNTMEEKQAHQQKVKRCL